MLFLRTIPYLSLGGLCRFHPYIIPILPATPNWDFDCGPEYTYTLDLFLADLGLLVFGYGAQVIPPSKTVNIYVGRCLFLVYLSFRRKHLERWEVLPRA